MTMVDTVKQLKKSIGSSRPAGSMQEVEFTLVAPDAKKVCLAGPFNNWNTQSMPMKKNKDGAWKIKMKLPHGKCEYKYFVDGTWVLDTKCAESAPNSFGTKNSVINVQ